MDDTKDFLGRGWAFPVGVHKATGQMRLSEYEQDVSEAIQIILSTRRGERVMRPDFGSNLHRFVFEAADSAARAKIAREVVEALTRWEPRITDITVNVDFPTGRGGGFLAEISYTVRGTNTPYNLVFPYFLTEGAVL